MQIQIEQAKLALLQRRQARLSRQYQQCGNAGSAKHTRTGPTENIYT